jgi:hypothetical protein
VLQASATATPTQTGTKGLSNYVAVTTSAVALPFTGLASVAYLFVKNESAVQVQLAMTSANFATEYFATMNQNDVCLIPMNRTPAPTIVYVKGASATNVFVAAVEV